MPGTRDALPIDTGDGFPGLLRTWRHRRRLSQLELALASGVSQRHISFLESGRSRPSRNMILVLSETLGVPLRDRNGWLSAAGFAPAYPARSLDDPQMRQVLAAVRLMLTSHAPFPAIAIDRAWNIKMANTPFDRFMEMLGPDIWKRIGGDTRNIMRLFFHPEGIRPYIVNWAVAAPLVWRRAQTEAEAQGGAEMNAVLSELAAYQDAGLEGLSDNVSLVPILPLEIEKDGVRISLFTIIATFGTPQDVTADELRVETLFPADPETEQLFQSMR